VLKCLLRRRIVPGVVAYWELSCWCARGDCTDFLSLWYTLSRILYWHGQDKDTVVRILAALEEFLSLVVFWVVFVISAGYFSFSPHRV
jgi:hypothetical protein